MTYQQPSMKQALKRLMDQGCRDIVVLPLFPQYASASTSASIAKVYELAATFRDPPALQIVPDFYNQAGYINAQASLIKRHLPESCDLLVFSFHGVPVRQLIKSGCQNAAACQSQACPERVAQCCYRAQCFETARAITKALKYEGEFTVAFQSRLGPIPWIKPYLDQSLTGWADRGIKNLVIVSASFTMDCLETLEEIHQEIKEQWLQLTQHQGQFTAVPCLNADPLWVETLGIWIKKMSNLDTAL
jgi:ferrochelatase